MANHASNALAAKARAKLGLRLTRQNYDQLLACNSVGEAGLYLKNRTQYGSVLGEIHTADVHRRRLEELLRRKAFEDFSSLCEFELAGRFFFYRIIVRREEIRQLLHCIRLLDFGGKDAYLFDMPSFFHHHTKLDLMALAQCTSFAEMVEQLKETPFEALLRPFIPTNGGKPNLTAIELTLMKYFYETGLRCIREDLHGRERNELLGLYEGEAVLKNLLRLMRVKRAFPEVPHDELCSMLIPCGELISKAHWQSMASSESPEAALEIFRSTAFGSFVQTRSFEGLEQEVGKHIFRRAFHTLHFSQSPESVFYAYTVLVENEIKNIINIIEGIRYGLPRESIRALLIYEDTAMPETLDPAKRAF